jgi:hypothetical protein
LNRHEGLLHPIGHGRVAKGHFARTEAFIPFGMAVGEHDVLALAVNLPEFRDVRVRRAAHAILRVIVLVRVQRVECNPAPLSFVPAVSPPSTNAEGNKMAEPLTEAKPPVATNAALQPLK